MNWEYEAEFAIICSAEFLWSSMESVIRDNDETNASSAQSWLLWLIIGFLFILILLSAGFAALNASSLGWPAILFLAGMALVGGLGVLSFFSARRVKPESPDRRYASRENPYSEAFFKSPDASLIVKDGKPEYANKAYLALAKTIGAMGVSQTPPSVDRLFSGSGKATASAIFRLHHMAPKTTYAEEFIDMLDGKNELRRYKVQVTALEDTHLWQIRDVTQSGLGEERTLVDAPVGLFSITTEGDVIATNTIFDRWMGGEDNVRPDHIREFIEDADTLLDSPKMQGRIVRVDTRLITRKGVVTPSIMVGTWHKLDSGEDIASVALYGHSSLATAKSSSSDVKAASLAKDSGGLVSAPVAVLHLEGTDLGAALIRSANPAFETMSGGIAWDGLPFKKIFATKKNEHRFLNLTADQCDAGKPFDATLSGDNGLPVSVYIVADNEGENLSWAYMVDVSTRKSLEDQLIQSQKMQAIGQLAAGVAHDFNNLLTAIRLNTDELLQRHPVGDPSYPELQNINTTGIRAAALVKKLLAFSRKQTRRMEILNVTETLSDMAVTLKQTLGERTKLDVIHGRGLSPIRADKSQIDTVLMNLCVNARDAMEQQGGGTITIRSAEMSRDEIIDQSVIVSLKDIEADSFIVMDVSDTGTGMTDIVKAKIFEPFFTTKELGKGTGLGLATVYGIVQQSGGHLTVDSKLGKGTTFRMYLPAADPSDVSQDVDIKAPAEVRKPVNLAGQGTILFVEDEASVRVIAAKTLRKRGYKVVEAEDGEEAFEILEDGEHDFDMMISDVVMPGMDGPTLLKKGRSMLGEARIVFISGYAEEEFSDLLSEEPDVTFLPKPFTLAQLAEKVKTEIGESET